MSTTVVIVNTGALPPGERLLVPQRVRRVVAALADRLGPELVIKQSEVAQAAGCSREEASRELARLERAGITKQGRGRIIVLDLAALNDEDGRGHHAPTVSLGGTNTATSRGHDVCTGS